MLRCLSQTVLLKNAIPLCKKLILPICTTVVLCTHCSTPKYLSGILTMARISDLLL